MPHGPRISDDSLRWIAHERIADGGLPVTFPHFVHAGYGSGRICRLCREPIERHQVEYEVTDDRDGRPFSLHLACHAIWQLECRALVNDGAAQGTDQAEDSSRQGI